MRIIAFWGLYWGPIMLGNYHISVALMSAHQSAHQSDAQPLSWSYWFLVGSKGIYYTGII